MRHVLWINVGTSVHLNLWITVGTVGTFLRIPFLRKNPENGRKPSTRENTHTLKDFSDAQERHPVGTFLRSYVPTAGGAVGTHPRRNVYAGSVG
jgi:hypothetical protein